MIRWPEYSQQFQELYDSLKGRILEHDAQECGPFLTTTAKHPSVAPWRLVWCIIFSDGNYMKVKETFSRCPAPYVGVGQREHFSFHYGPTPRGRDSFGMPTSNNHRDGIIRIDKHEISSTQTNKIPKAHLHLNGEQHIPQERVQGFLIEEAKVGNFVEALINHRQTGQKIDDILCITVRPPL